MYVNFVSTLLLLLPLSSSISEDVCSDGLDLSCDTECPLSVTIGTSTPSCRDSVTLSIWSETAPSLSLSCDAPVGKKFGLLMTDPDAPNCASPRAKYWLHWLTLNANLKDGKFLDFSGADVVAPFAPPTPPTPPAGSPPFHRYQFTVFSYSGTKSAVTANGVRSIMAGRKDFRAEFANLFQNYDVVAQTELRTKRD